jgi:hypothetical protein
MVGAVEAGADGAGDEVSTSCGPVSACCPPDGWVRELGLPDAAEPPAPAAGQIPPPRLNDLKDVVTLSVMPRHACAVVCAAVATYDSIELCLRVLAQPNVAHSPALAHIVLDHGISLTPRMLTFSFSIALLDMLLAKVPTSPATLRVFCAATAPRSPATCSGPWCRCSPCPNC